jgi:tetratricopeptide (TPR) repeat protein
MSDARLRWAVLTLAVAVGCPGGVVHAQGIAPVKQAAPAKGGKQKAAAPNAQSKNPAAASKALENGIKLYQSGKNDAAVEALSVALQGGLPSQDVARALYYRGAAYRKQGKPVLAISDLKSALWLKGGLSEAERGDATLQHAAAYKDAGLGEAPAIERTTAVAEVTSGTAKAAEKRAVETPVAAAPQAGTGQAAGVQIAGPGPGPAQPVMSLAQSASAPEPAAETASGGGITGFFSNLFGGMGSSQSSATETAQAAQRPLTTASTAPPQPQVSSWADSTTVAPRRSGQLAKVAAAEAVATPAAGAAAKTKTAKRVASVGGKFRLEVGSTTSREEAVKIAQRLKSEHGAEFASREMNIDEGKFGSSSYYRVGVGPYATADEPGKLCRTLKSKGLDCVVVTR